MKPTAVQTHLRSFGAQMGGKVFADKMNARDGHQLRLQLMTEDAGILIAAAACKSPAPQRTINMDAARRGNFRPGAD